MNNYFTPDLISESVLINALKNEPLFSPCEKVLDYIKEFAKTYTPVKNADGVNPQGFMLN